MSMTKSLQKHIYNQSSIILRTISFYLEQQEKLKDTNRIFKNRKS